MDLVLIRNAFLGFIFGMFLIGCRPEDGCECHYFVPDGYEGPVIIKYEAENSNNRMIKYGDKVFFVFITGDPSKFELRDIHLPRCYFQYHTYYYSKDTLYEINTAGGMGDVLDSKYPLASQHATLGAVNTGMSAYFWVDKDENTEDKKDSLINAAKKLWEMGRE
ncbi:hypothetical protein LAG90_12090 [Marinilongibacter aquaticus]|uniref:hypothetical protein n=1 Tax=Marinilongibacter aquaticus TaxID=2975157 RepID=UPI0021BD852E|nr:hypothetical protein [Marinilongibacter aquaticus]UBM57558.1 hypothetical protein LAG90_12090 [Marinilongibacter aquaticus]